LPLYLVAQEHVPFPCYNHSTFRMPVEQVREVPGEEVHVELGVGAMKEGARIPFKLGALHLYLFLTVSDSVPVSHTVSLALVVLAARVRP
jgi:hypothetical protein